MRLPALAFILALAGMGGSVAGARPARKPKAKPAASRVQKQKAPRVKGGRAARADVAAPLPKTHKVRKGESALRIAREAGLDLEELQALNPKVKLARLSAGQILKLSGKAHRAASTPVRTRALPASGTLAALPGLPALRPGSLPHLERIFPSTTHAAPSELGLPRTSGQMVAQIQPVVPEGGLPEAPHAPMTFAALDAEHLDLLWPVETRTVSSAWGPRMRSRTVKVAVRPRKRSRKLRMKQVKVRYQGSHKGVDLNAPSGTDVYAALDGVVITSVRHPQYGNCVVIDHGSGVVTLYAHNSVNFVQEGEVVKRGQKIAEVGATGHATGPHLHFELRVDGNHRNPLPFLNDQEEIDAELAARNAELASPEPPAPASRARRRR